MRQEIQGLRAVAVLLVVFFHLWPSMLPGGYVGVDVFFVISGFLITSHILREVDRSGSVSLTQFWARRIRRLLPAAYLVLAVSAVTVLVFVPRLVWQQFFGEILAAALYVENWTLAFNSVDYLAAENTPSPAQHYWTLSAEEQFYLVWPLLVLLGLWLASRLFRGRNRTGVFAVLGAATVASLGYSLWITATNSAWAYFVTPARAWEFGAGALLAFAPAAAKRVPPVVRALLGWAALVTLLVCAVVLDAKTPMPGTAAIWVVVASAMLIWVEAPPVPWASSQLMVTRPARFLGDISYSIYLWHWPFIILLPYVTDHALTTIDRFSILLATIGASYLTKRYVEDPVRQARHFGLASPRTTFVYAAVGAVALTALCVVPRSEVTRDLEQKQRVTAELMAHPPRCFGAESRDPTAKDCPNPRLEDVMVPGAEGAGVDRLLHPRCSAPLRADPLRPCVFGTPEPGVPRVAVIGDSHARLIMAMLQDKIEAGDLVVDMFVLSACPWSTNGPNRDGGKAGRECGTMHDKLFPLLDRTATKYDAILTTSRVNRLRGTIRERVTGVVEAWERVTKQGVPVFALRDNPTSDDPERNPNFCLAEADPAKANQTCSIDRAERLDHWFDAYAVAARRVEGAHEIDLTDFYCDKVTCPVVIGGVNVYTDNNHLTVTYARTLGPYLLKAMAKEGVDLR